MGQEEVQPSCHDLVVPERPATLACIPSDLQVGEESVQGLPSSPLTLGEPGTGLAPLVHVRHIVLGPQGIGAGGMEELEEAPQVHGPGFEHRSAEEGIALGVGVDQVGGALHEPRHLVIHVLSPGAAVVPGQDGSGRMRAAHEGQQ